MRGRRPAATLAHTVALLLAVGCSSGPRSPDPSAGIVVGGTQGGGEPLVRADGVALLSEAYTIYPDGRVVIVENYTDTVLQRAGAATPVQARRLIHILQSDTWRTLPDDADPPVNPDDVKFTIDTEGKSV